MTDLEKLRQWLQTYPKWEDAICVDFSTDAPGCVGIFPEGLVEVGRQEDLLGNLQVDCRYRFVLLRQTTNQKGAAENAEWLMEFQNWVLAQNAAGLVPQFGDDTRIQPQKSGLKSVSQSGIATYTVTLVADFVRTYQAG